jgi:hypothetical protein
MYNISQAGRPTARTLALHFIVAATLSVSALAQSEFVVNSTLKAAQRGPRIARDADGNYGVVWKSEGQVDSSSRGDIVLRFFNSNDSPITGEILVNTVTAGDQDKPAVAMNGRGDLIVVWASFTGFQSLYDIKARIFKNRAPSGDEFLVNTTTIHTQTNPAVAVDDDGNFVVVWDSWFQDGGDKGVYGRLLNSNGQPQTGEFLVNQTTAYSQARPMVKYMTDGRFVAVWESWKQDVTTPSGYGLFGRVFNMNAAPVGNEFQINTYTNDYQWFGDIEVFDDNSFVVTWCSWEQDGDDGGIYLQRFDSAGKKLGAEMPVNQTTVQYQWLPKIRKFPDQTFAVVWSSWKQDGDLEGVYARAFDSSGKPISFETQVNLYTQSFQWEPDCSTMNTNDLLVVWSSWGKTGKNDYDIIARRVKLIRPVGLIKQSSWEHVAGRSTTDLLAHIVDFSALKGHTYGVGFDSIGVNSFSATIRDNTTGDTVVSRYPINRGKNSFYLTPVFHGLVIEIVPVFTLELDAGHSTFVNHSGTNLMFQTTTPTVGTPRLAPIDIALIWGRTDTLADGRFAQPLDTAFNISGQRVVAVPFKAWNLIDQQKVELLVVEATGFINQRFDPGERIVFLTPLAYRMQANNTHAQISTSLPTGTPVMPAAGDTNYVLTSRPLSTIDRYRFTASSSMIVKVDVQNPWAKPDFILHQNYPNPFNPTTTIRFSVPSKGRTVLKLFNIVGQEVRTLADDIRDAGEYRVLLDGRDLPTGVYVYVLRINDSYLVRKMVLIK